MDRKMREQGSTPLEDLLPRAPSGVKLSPKGNAILKGKSAPKRRKKPSQTKTRRPARVRYLEAVVMALVRGQPQPKPFKKMSAAEREEIESFPSRLDWARQQPEFAAIEQRERARLAAKTVPKTNGQAKAATPAKANVRASDPESAKRISFLRSEIAAAQQFISAAEKEIAKLLAKSGKDGS